ncbi:hypothetical protein [Haliangium sp.]|uniref:hypothetical protein n=1 Tax=Haliangium sp. TaxID=2663208 RepID=UPI003D12BDEA
MRHAGILPLVGLMALGCSGGSGDDGPPPEGPDAAVLDGGADAGDPPQGAGLRFRFRSEPDLPGKGDVGGEFDAVIERVALDLVQVRAIGDSAPGDERTRADRFTLDWADASAIDLAFPQAPPGLYSQLLGEIMSYQIEGNLRIGDDRVPFRIHEDEARLALAVALDGLMLEPGMDRTVEIDVHLNDVVRVIDWDSVTQDGDGWLTVDPDGEAIDSVREAVEEAFEVENGGSSGEG